VSKLRFRGERDANGHSSPGTDGYRQFEFFNGDSAGSPPDPANQFTVPLQSMNF